jgi:putative hemolysin
MLTPRWLAIVPVLAVTLLLAGCLGVTSQGTGGPPATGPAPSEVAQPTSAGTTGIANPASVFCADNGGALEIRLDAVGNQYGVCVFPDGSECEEWAYYRGECKPGQGTVPPPTAAPGATVPPESAVTPPPSATAQP